MNISEKIALELNIRIQQVDATIQLLDAGDTVPFISRYRKEITGSLTDTQLRQLEERLRYLRELEDRRQTILKSIKEQNKLTPELQKSILEADNKATLEDLYLPYKPKRQTKAQIAKNAGLEPLALQLLAHPESSLDETAANFLNAEQGINTIKDALDGARHILLELFAEDAQLIGYFREFLWEKGIIKSEVLKGKEVEGNKFSDYFNYQESIKKIPSHRALAFFRGQREGILNVNLSISDDETSLCVLRIQQTFGIHNKNRPAASIPVR